MKTIRKSLITGCAAFLLLTNMAGLLSKYFVLKEEEEQRINAAMVEQAQELLRVVERHSTAPQENFLEWTINELERLGYAVAADWTLIYPLFENHYSVSAQIWYEGICYGPENGSLCNEANKLTLTQAGYGLYQYEGGEHHTFTVYDVTGKHWVKIGVAVSQIEQKIWQRVWRLSHLQFVFLFPISLLLIWLWLGRVLRPLNVLNQQLRQERYQSLSLPPYQEWAPLIEHYNAFYRASNEMLQVRHRASTEFIERVDSQCVGILRALQDGEEGHTRARYHAQKLEQNLNLIRIWLMMLHHEPLSPRSLTSVHQVIAKNSRDFFSLSRRMGRRLQVQNVPEHYYTTLPPIALHALLNALLDNALRYSPPQGIVQLHVQSCPQRDNQIWLSVADSGVGLTQQQLDSVPALTSLSAWSRPRLGLGIVKAVCAHYDIELVLSRCSVLGGTLIQLGFAITVGSGSEVKATAA